jgi:hypothetical protein
LTFEFVPFVPPASYVFASKLSLFEEDVKYGKSVLQAKYTGCGRYVSRDVIRKEAICLFLFPSDEESREYEKKIDIGGFMNLKFDQIRILKPSLELVKQLDEYFHLLTKETDDRFKKGWVWLRDGDRIKKKFFARDVGLLTFRLSED